MIRSIEDVRRWVGGRHQPQFILPARFHDASFDSFQIADDRPEHHQLIDRVRQFIQAARPAPRRFWERQRTDTGNGLFLVGPPGVGKTHLLAAGYTAGTAPKLFANFDELAAAAGPLGIDRLAAIIRTPDLVCIDEIVLEDPGNIMLLATLLHHMMDAGTHVFATANMPPHEAGGKSGWIETFERELGAIASVFEVVRVQGEDRRLDQDIGSDRQMYREGAVLEVTWEDLAAYLRDVHPMNDAGWLDQLCQLTITTAVAAPPDKDRALRFVRFIDRVYDRNVRLCAAAFTPSPDEILGPLVGDKRYVWHVARGQSRLTVLLASPPHQER